MTEEKPSLQLYPLVNLDFIKRYPGHIMNEDAMSIQFPQSQLDQEELYRCLLRFPIGKKKAFFFAITKDQIPTLNTLKEGMGRFLFLRSYQLNENGFPVFMNIAPSYLENDTAELDDWAVAQGFESNNNTSEKRPCIVEEELTQHTKEKIEQLIVSDLNHCSSLFLFKLKTAEDFDLFCQLKKELNSFVKNQFPAFLSMLQANERACFSIQQLTAEVKFLRERVETIQVVATHFDRSQETQKILQFYHSEYEVLPLWFKRVGHIIKIMTGKRKLTLRKKRT